MPVIKPRNRLVNFRLSEEEFEKLRASCALTGARSLSDFARDAVMRSVATGLRSNEERAGEVRTNEIDQKVHDLESRVGELMNMMQGLLRDSGTEEARPAGGSAVGVTQS